MEAVELLATALDVEETVGAVELLAATLDAEDTAALDDEEGVETVVLAALESAGEVLD